LDLSKRVERTSKRTLAIGEIVQLHNVAASAAGGEATYRVEALLQLANDVTLYKIKCETEPFDRIVSECDLAPQP
jgi:hypothetical protein